jgi:purine-nucleoside phosphorylase
MMKTLHEQLGEAVAAIRRTSDLQPRIGIILGSGLGPLADEVADSTAVPYEQIPHFPISTAPGHAGKLVLGQLDAQPVVAMAGRVHLYEGYTPEQVVFPVRTMRKLGAEMLLLTNAAGGVNPHFGAGTLMAISDQINFTGRNPLVGPNDVELGARFPDMSEAYSTTLRDLAHGVARQFGIPLAEGVYMGVLGPNFETPAEIRMARAFGADAVGMSTVMEVLAAQHCGMHVLGISCITNMGAGILPHKLTEAEVFDTAQRVRHEFARLVRGIVAAYGPAVS